MAGPAHRSERPNTTRPGQMKLLSRRARHGGRMAETPKKKPTLCAWPSTPTPAGATARLTLHLASSKKETRATLLKYSLTCATCRVAVPDDTDNKPQGAETAF